MACVLTIGWLYVRKVGPLIDCEVRDGEMAMLGNFVHELTGGSCCLLGRLVHSWFGAGWVSQLRQLVVLVDDSEIPIKPLVVERIGAFLGTGNGSPVPKGTGTQRSGCAPSAVVNEKMVSAVPFFAGRKGIPSGICVIEIGYIVAQLTRSPVKTLMDLDGFSGYKVNPSNPRNTENLS